MNDLFTGDYAITAQNNFSPIPIAAADAAAKAPGVTAVGNVRTGEARVFGNDGVRDRGRPGDEGGDHHGLDRRAPRTRLATLGDDGAFVDDGYAKDHDLQLGSPIRVTFPNGTTRTFVIKGIFDPPTGGSPFGDGDDLGRRRGTQEVPAAAEPLLVRQDDRRRRPTRTRRRSTRRSPTSRTRRRRRARSSSTTRSRGLSAILNILYVLLALSIVVSLFGIVNTLVLTVFERTREIGMLRAIGMTRRQVRRMIRHESVITALIGAAIGIVLGIVLAGAADRPRRLHRVLRSRRRR